VHLDLVAGLRQDAVATFGAVTSRSVELALESLTDDLHVQEPEEATAESEAECLRVLGLVEESRRSARLSSASRTRVLVESVGKSPAKTIGLTSL
jgi:hypothetical protein